MPQIPKKAKHVNNIETYKYVNGDAKDSWEQTRRHKFFINCMI